MQFNELPERERIRLQIHRIKGFLVRHQEEHLTTDLFEIQKYIEKLEGFQVVK